MAAAKIGGMNTWQYFRFCLANSFHGPFAIAHGIEFVLVIVGGAVARYCPGLNEQMALLLWLIPLVVFIATFVMAMIIIPGKISYNRQIEFENRISKTASEAVNKVANRVNNLESSIKELSGSANMSGDEREKVERLKSAKWSIQRYADDAPKDSAYLNNEGWKWCDGAQLMLRNMVKPHKCNNFWHTSNANNYNDLFNSVASLRAIASDLRIEDLLD